MAYQTINLGSGENSIGSVIRKAESNFISGNIITSRYVILNPYEDLNTIDAYLNSKHISGEFDALGREKPFFNIVLATKNITARGTDLDRKNLHARAHKAKQELASFLYSIHMQRWMRDVNFGTFLNNWGDYLAAYNSTIVKVVEKTDELHINVMDWNKMIVDFIDFDSNPKIERLELTEAQLRQRPEYNQDIVDALCNALSTRQLPDGQAMDNNNDFIKLYEIHGNLPLMYLTGKESDQYTYVQQMHVVSFIASKQEGKFDDFTLVSGKEKRDPYRLTWLTPSVDGSINLDGSVKKLFTAQWMENHTAKLIKDQLDLASKIILQTADSSYKTKNVLSSIETGDILIHKAEMPLTVVPNNAHDITALQSFGQQWKGLAQELSNTPDITYGMGSSSSSAYRKEAVLLQQSQENFNIMGENKALHLEGLFKDFITPFLLKKMDTTEEIAATLDSYGVDKIDQMYVASESVKRFNKKAVEAVIKRGDASAQGKDPNQVQMPNLADEQAQVQQELSNATQRYIKPSEISTKTWKQVIGEFEGDIVYEFSDENKDKQEVLSTLSNVLTTIVSNPMMMQDPNAKLLFNKILTETGIISPIELQDAQNKPAPTPVIAPTTNEPAATMVGGRQAGM